MPDCPICFVELSAPTEEAGGDTAKEVVATPCGHVFHRVCLTTWLAAQAARRKYCPICKAVCRECSLVQLFVDWSSSEEISRSARKATPCAAQVRSVVRIFSDRAERLGRDKAELLLDKSKLLAEKELCAAKLYSIQQSSAVLTADLRKLRHYARTLADDRRNLARKLEDALAEAAEWKARAAEKDSARAGSPNNELPAESMDLDPPPRSLASPPSPLPGKFPDKFTFTPVAGTG